LSATSWRLQGTSRGDVGDEEQAARVTAVRAIKRRRMLRILEGRFERSEAREAFRVVAWNGGDARERALGSPDDVCGRRTH
jgi:hypothetical protein